MSKLTNYISGALAVLGLCAGATTAMAQNTAHNTGDLILAFQNPGGTTGSDKVLLVSLGNAAQLYRAQTSSTFNIANIGTLLTTTFGSDWSEQSTLYMGALSAWSSSGLSTGLSNGDPTRTVYVSAARTDVGVFGEASSVGWSGISAGNLGTAAGRMLQIAGNLETGGEGFALTLSTTASLFDDNNPFVGANQGTAYSTFTGGTQFQFGLGGFGTMAGVEAEGALDLYRFQARNDITGQFGFGETNGTGSYLGSLVIDGAGNVSFAAVPEPGSVMLLGVAGVAALAFGRRFRRLAPSK